MRKLLALLLLSLTLAGRAQQVRLDATGFRTTYSFSDYRHSYSFDARFDEDGQLQGPIVIYQEIFRDNRKDSVLVFRGNYVNGRYADTLTWYYESGRLKRIAILNSALQPSAYWYDLSGMKISGAPEGEVTEWYDQLVKGTQQVKSIHRYVNGKQSGLQQEFYASGGKKREWNMKNGSWNGPYTEWYENGNKSEECMYVNGMRTGKRTMFYENGNALRVYANGTGNDTVTNYYPNGKIDDVTLYRDYERNGDYRQYDSLTGKVVDYRFYRDDRRDSIRMEYYPSGKKMAVSHYSHGVRNGKYESWYENGKLKTRGTYLDGYKNGQWDYYDEKGLPNHSVDYSKTQAPWESDSDFDPNPVMEVEAAAEAFTLQFVLPTINGAGIPKTIKPEDKLKFMKNYTTLEAIAVTSGDGKFTYTITTPMKPGEAQKFEAWLNANYPTGSSSFSRYTGDGKQPWTVNVRITVSQ